MHCQYILPQSRNQNALVFLPWHKKRCLISNISSFLLIWIDNAFIVRYKFYPKKNAQTSRKFNLLKAINKAFQRSASILIIDIDKSDNQNAPKQISWVSYLVCDRNSVSGTETRVEFRYRYWSHNFFSKNRNCIILHFSEIELHIMYCIFLLVVLTSVWW